MKPVERRIHRLLTELRRQGVTDPRVLAALAEVPRDDFVPAPFRDQAYENLALPIGCGQTISQPLVVGLMTQALEIGPRMKVLEIGTGSGYQTALLSLLARRVESIERHRPLLAEAEARLRRLHRHNVTCRHGDGSLGWPQHAPFDRIIVTAAATELPPALLAQLRPDGILVLPLAVPGLAGEQLVRVTLGPDGPVLAPFLPVRFVPLVAGLP
ncbi:protein-L-isoaspartate(D-aspartate) O-methyltransferase [Phaeospirillum tilakii]|uniref:Protein-L-isoaspartate O-methyltransferase n=1 Tax=Phaeospirillum tilakii TaxID=741673 RepID=A0ABW5C8P8_9PROT